MQLEVFLSALAAAGLSLTRHGDTLTLPDGAPAALVDALHEHQATLLALVGSTPSQAAVDATGDDQDDDKAEREVIQAEGNHRWTQAELQEAGRQADLWLDEIIEGGPYAERC